MKSNWGVNWKNGMKINSDHFLKERLHNAFYQSMAAKASVNENNFGLIHYPGVKSLSFKLYNNRISMDSCFGMTRGGWVVYINEENNRKIESLETEAIRRQASPGDRIQVYVKIIPNQANEFGVIDGEAFPVNYPDASFSYKIEYQSASDAVDADNLNLMLPFAMLKVSQSGIDLDPEYIPPSMSIRADEKLMGFYNRYNETNFKMARTTSVVAQNLAPSSHSSYVRNNIKNLCQNLTVFLADQLDTFMIKSPDESPVNVFLFYKRMSRIINASLANMENRSEMVSLLAEWSEQESKEFMQLMNDVGSINYNHMDIYNSFQVIENYMQVIEKLFENLSSANI